MPVSCSISSILLLLLAASPWLVWSAVRKGKYREGYAEKLLGLCAAADVRQEVRLAARGERGRGEPAGPVAAVIERERPDWECVISTTTKTGMALAKKKYAGRTVFYCPLDFSWAVQCGDAAGAARRARAGRIGTVAEPGRGPPGARGAGRGHQRAVEPAELRGLSPHPPADGAAAAEASIASPCRMKRMPGGSWHWAPGREPST